MSDIKCPFCNRNLHKGEDGIYSHLDYMTECKGRLFDGSKELWQELIRTKELLEIESSEHELCHDAMVKRTEEVNQIRKELKQSETCCTEWEKQALDYKAENIALSGDLERTRKALDVAVDALKSAKTRFELINNSKFANLNNVLQIQSQCEILKIDEALEQITALEQKDVK